MIHINIHEDEPIKQYLDAQTQQTGRDQSELIEEMLQAGFYTIVKNLHDQFMRGEISQGYMAEYLGINRVDLIHLLDQFNLQVTNL